MRDRESQLCHQLTYEQPEPQSFPLLVVRWCLSVWWVLRGLYNQLSPTTPQEVQEHPGVRQEEGDLPRRAVTFYCFPGKCPHQKFGPSEVI